MRFFVLACVLFLVGMTAAPAQKRQVEYDVPKVTDQELWEKRRETDPWEAEMERDIRLSETGPFRQKKAVVESTRFDTRLRANLSNKYLGPQVAIADRATRELATRDDPSRVIPDTEMSVGVLAATIEYLAKQLKLSQRSGKPPIFLSVGEFGDDPPEVLLNELIAAAEQSQDLEKIEIVPGSRAIVVSGDGVRDRNSGKYGIIFRAGPITPMPDGKVGLRVSYAGREFVFAKDFILEETNGSWAVVDEGDAASQGTR